MIKYINLITDLESIEDLVLDFYKKFNITDLKRIERFIDRTNQKIDNNDALCWFYEKDNTQGFLVGEYYSDNKFFEISTLYFGNQNDKCVEEIIECVEQVSKEILNSITTFFRFKLGFVVETEFLNLLIQKGFKTFARHTMSIDLDERFKKITFPRDYQIEDYDLKRYFEDCEVVINSYKNNIDSEIFPEVLIKPYKIDDDVEDHYLSPQIIHKGRIIASVHAGENLSQTKGFAAWLDNLSVMKEFQGKGLGKKLMQATLYRCYKKKYKRLGLHVTAENIKALALYKKLGFKIMDKFYFFTKEY